MELSFIVVFEIFSFLFCQKEKESPLDKLNREQELKFMNYVAGITSTYSVFFFPFLFCFFFAV